jgi:hypothetical protein
MEFKAVIPQPARVDCHQPAQPGFAIQGRFQTIAFIAMTFLPLLRTPYIAGAGKCRRRTVVYKLSHPYTRNA